MSTKSQEVGNALLQGIDTLEAGAHDTVHAGAVGARHATKASSRWAARQEAAAVGKTRMLKKDLKKQAAGLRRSVSDSVVMAGDKARETVASGERYVKRKPWTAIAIASGTALVVGALLGRRRS